ncbi:MAG: RNA polymerase sigma-70 factor (ECF subfamily) [Oceanicoccus sp.]|jgi:RNA polymerase sigma-70 factor (ECF subfamily)
MTVDLETERKLIEAAQADPHEFVALYDLHFDAVYRFLVSRSSNTQLAEDLTSDTFMIAMDKIKKFKWSGKPYRSWLYRVAINELNQYYRKHKKERELAIKQWKEEGDQFEAADTNLKKKEDQEEALGSVQALNLSFGHLKAKEQDILSLRFFEDLSYEEISQTLNISVSNVGVRLNRALKRLQSLHNPQQA